MIQVLVTGANGQLGREIRRCSANYPEIEFHYSDIDGIGEGTTELDITLPGAVENFLDKNPVSYIINCAAYTAVDNAEDDEEGASRLNAGAVGILAKESARRDIRMVHISTDYVFNGEKNRPYKPDDPVDPRTAYGRTKLAGEKALLASGKGIIVRTSWLYSVFGKNFVKTILRLSGERNKLDVVFDQTGSPTNARDFAGAVLAMIGKTWKDMELYHYSNRGVCSWFEFATEIVNLAGRSCKVEPVESINFPTRALRPRYSVMDSEKIVQDFSLEIPHWKDSLRICIEELSK